MPSVVMTAGPIRPRMVQRGQAQRDGALIERSSRQRSSLTANLISEHIQASSDQDERPKSADADERENAKIVEQKQKSQANQDNWADRTLLAPGLQRVDRRFTAIPGLGSLHGFESGIENETSEKNAKHGLEAVVEIAGQAENDRCKNSDVNEALIVLAIVDGTQARKNERKNQSGAGVALIRGAWVGGGYWRGVRGCRRRSVGRRSGNPRGVAHPG